ncbi:MAG: hypothetical protein N2557_06245 [Hydrogenophilus sp.]|nr:hypothetical protein [Hydrogenophilus sp.]
MESRGWSRRRLGDRLGLVVYGGGVVGVTLVHDPVWLTAAGVGVWLGAGKERGRLLRRALRLALPWLVVVSVGYGMVAFWSGLPVGEVLLRLNLRVGVLVLLTVVFATRVSLLRAVDFSPTLVWLFTMVMSQMVLWQRLYEEFRLALVSRSPGEPDLRTVLQASANAIAWFADQALATARNQAQALRARGLLE